jgi:hypothetical protein
VSIYVLVLDCGAPELKKRSSASLNITIYAATLLTFEFMDKMIYSFNYMLSVLFHNSNIKRENDLAP